MVQCWGPKYTFVCNFSLEAVLVLPNGKKSLTDERLGNKPHKFPIFNEVPSLGWNIAGIDPDCHFRCDGTPPHPFAA